MIKRSNERDNGKIRCNRMNKSNVRSKRNKRNKRGKYSDTDN